MQPVIPSLNKKGVDTGMKRTLSALSVVFAAALTGAAPAHAAPFADSLRNNFQVGQCCGTTIDKCVKQKPACAIAPKLAAFITWMDSLGTATNPKMAEALQDRYATLTATQKHAIDTKGWPVTGDAKAPTTIVMYFSGTCPTCKNNFKELHAAVTAGPLKGKVKIVSKPLGSGVANRALAAANEFGRFSDFMLALAAQANARIDEDVLYATADNMLFDRNRFRELVESKELATRVEQSTQEANMNGVTHVPTYFISGRRYNSILTPRWVIDAVEIMGDPGAAGK